MPLAQGNGQGLVVLQKCIIHSSPYDGVTENEVCNTMAQQPVD
jgi:hypothetical protein